MYGRRTQMSGTNILIIGSPYWPNSKRNKAEKFLKSIDKKTSTVWLSYMKMMGATYIMYNLCKELGLRVKVFNDEAIYEFMLYLRPNDKLIMLEDDNYPLKVIGINNIIDYARKHQPNIQMHVINHS